MNCFFCATPYHIIASMALASGTMSGDPSTLVVMDHFSMDDGMLDRIRSTGIFREVILYTSNNKTKWNKAKRLLSVFCPDQTIRKLAHKTAFSHCVFFALDFLNLGYMAKVYRKRGIPCEFSFGDDGIGAYLNANCYRPKPLVVKLLKLSGRLDALRRVRLLYVYKPELMVENTDFTLRKIDQSREVYESVKKAVSQIFLLGPDADVNNAILYFEQPGTNEASSENIEVEKKVLHKAMQQLKARVVVKMHPRSTSEALFEEFEIMKTKMPFEAMVLQQDCAPVMMLSNCSTAMFSMYLLDNLPAAKCPAVFLNRYVPNQNEHFNNALARYRVLVDRDGENQRIFTPENEQQLQMILDRIAKNKADN